ncbi:hypothetical protein llg_38290 [Luteolibacter sp. LG18]|nr:hypothetical protein llg_38290 [Luteolibacter sp. LG18]
MPLAFAGGLSFNETSKVLQAEADAKTVNASFAFTNKGDKEVTIKRIESSCSCLASGPEGKKLSYAPGESGTIQAAFDVAAATGSVEKQIGIWLDGDPEDKPSVQLDLKVTIPEVITIEPKTLKWETGSEVKAQSIVFTVNWREPVRFTGVTTGSTAFTHELKTLVEGKKYELVIKPQATKEPALGVFHLATDCKLEKYQDVMAYAVVRRPLPGEAKAASKP